MTESVSRILDEAGRLSPTEREELVDRLVEELVHDTPPDIQRSHIAEVRRRIAEVESGKVTLVPGTEAMQRVRRLLDASRGG